jgi:chromosome partitioning protein
LPTVAFISPKGGAGKTTAALLLALGLAEKGERVAIIDSDPNKPLLAWSELPGRPESLSIHPAPTPADVRESLREARRREAGWIILDTEGSYRGALAFRDVRPDLIVTPLAASQLEVTQALKAAELVRGPSGKSNRGFPHACLLTRIPTDVSPEALREVMIQLSAAELPILPTPILEHPAFRALFNVGGGLAALEADGMAGVRAARTNAEAYIACITDFIARRRREAAAAVGAEPVKSISDWDEDQPEPPLSSAHPREGGDPS